MDRRPMILVSLAALALMAIASLYAWTQLPADARIPIHWGVDGQPDGYADKVVGLWLLPVVTAAVAVVLALVPRIEPRRSNLERSGKPYAATWIGVVLLLGLVHLLAVAVALGATLDLTRIVLAAAGVLFVVIGNYLPKVRPNFLLGIRTPWTLTSDLAWARTHRLGGRLMLLLGVALAAVAILGIDLALTSSVLIAGIAGLVAVLFVYSYLVWRDDPARQADPGTLR
jgi:uncharacterized membrane protein